MRRFTFILFVYMCWTIAAISQDLSTQETIKNINKIKMDSKYLYAESTNKEWEEAYENSKALLGVMISEWAMKNADKEVDLYVAQSKEHILSIKTRRGDLYRSFVYVKKSDIIPISDERELMVVKMDKNTDHADLSITQANELDDVEKKDITNETTAIVEPEILEDQDDPIAVALAIEEKMKKIRSFYEIENFVNRLKKDNRLKSFGKYKTMPDNENCYLLVYNPQGKIPAVLKRNGKNYFNLNTHQADNISNYEGCGAIWILLNN